MKRQKTLHDLWKRVAPAAERPLCRVVYCEELAAVHPSGVVQAARGEVHVVRATKARKRVRKEQLEGDELAAEVLRRKHPPSEERVTGAARNDGGEGDGLVHSDASDRTRRSASRKVPTK